MEKKEDLQYEYTQCPKCKHTIPSYKEYVSWCESCGWNLEPVKPSKRITVFDRIQLKLGEKYSRELFKDMLGRSNIKPGFTISMIFAYILSLLIHSISILIGITGVLVIYNGWPSRISIIVGILLLLLTYYLVPKPYGKPKNIVSREEYPELYKLVDELAYKIGSKKINEIAIDEEFNAFYTQYGLKRKKVIGIGIPLFSMLDNEERVGVLCHELAHGINGDIKRNYIVYTAIKALCTWFTTVYPRRIFDTDLDWVGLMLVPFNILMLGFAKIIYLVIILLERLTWSSSQTAEYLADYYGTSICGTAAHIRALEKTSLYEVYYNTVASYAVGQIKVPLFEAVNERIRILPDRERERIRRVGIMENSRLDCTHPPTLYRVEFLKKNNVYSNMIDDLDERMKRIDKELISIKNQMESKIIDEYMYSINSYNLINGDNRVNGVAL